MKRVLLPCFALVLLSACGQTGDPDIRIGDAWARPTRGEVPGAVYVAIDNKGSSDDRLTGVSTDRAAMAMVHQSDLADGVATMRMVDEVRILAGGRIEMAPGGTHIMLEGLKAPLNSGESFDIVLKFGKSGDRRVRVDVRTEQQ